MSIMRCPRCSNQWDSDYDDRQTELCMSCEELEMAEENLEFWPERIYLQRHDDCIFEGCKGPHGEDTTWCSDKINDHDVEYVRADLVKRT